MQRFYSKYSDEIDDAEELEHRIARVEASMEGCNGLTQDEKIQKTAENVFELTCAQERSYDALRMELRRTRDEWKDEFASIRQEIKKGLEGVVKKIEDSGMDSSASVQSGTASKLKNSKILSKFIMEHPLIVFNAFIFILILVFVSGHFEILAKMFGGG